MTTAAPSWQPAWMPHAWAELGQHEIQGPHSNPRISDYIRLVHHQADADDSTPWCAAYVGACLERAGIASSGSLLARSYLDWGTSAGNNAFGAIAVLSRGADPSQGHVGFLVGETADAVYLLGGNQSDAVGVARFDRARLLGLRLPNARPLASRAPSPRSERASFSWSLERILAFEGGWTDDPYDPGGPTNKGITLAVFARNIGEEVTAQSFSRLKDALRAIPDTLVETIYLSDYWQPACCAELPAALAHFHFDTAVNQGVTGAALMLQRALGVSADGEIGPITLRAAHTMALTSLLDRYADIRRRRYRSLRHFWRFGRGWLSRVDQALAQARSLIPPAPDGHRPNASFSTSPTKEKPEMPSTPNTTPASTGTPKWWGQSLTIWGVLLTTFSTVAPTLFSAMGFDVSADMIQHLGNNLMTTMQAIGGLLGTIMAIIGRTRASTPLSARSGLPRP
ncbi:MAG: TIGR02594 family protein [Hyphomicrobiaceae bacterium]